MSDKYLNIFSYAYCNNTPVISVAPNEGDWYETKSQQTKHKETKRPYYIDLKD